MKKALALIAALMLCLTCVGCASGGTETEATTAATEAPAVTEAETLPPETVAEIEPAPVEEEPTDEYFKFPNFRFGYQTGDAPLEVFECRMYPMDNGSTRFEVDYKTIAGLQPVVYAFADDGDDDPNFWLEMEELTTNEESTLVFEMENDLLYQVYHPGIIFRDQFGFDTAWTEIFYYEEMFKVTDGNPVGEATKLLTAKDGDVKVHSATMQELDNGYVRFTIDCTPKKNRYISFYNPPEGSNFMCISQEPTTGERQTIVADVRADDVGDLKDFNLNFFNGDAAVARIYLSTPITDFAELDESMFASFIGGKQFMILYYGVIDDAVMGATITAEDGTSVEVTKKIIDKNGDGHTLLIFKEFKAKKDDTVSITLSKEGYEDIVLSLYVH